MEQFNDLKITDQVKQDHYTDNFVHDSIINKMEKFQREYIQPFFETRLLLSEIQSLISDPERSKVLTKEEKEYIESILYRPISNEPPHRHYAEQVFGLTENDLQVPPKQIKNKLNNQIDLAIKEKYRQVYNIASIYQPTTTTTTHIIKEVEQEEKDDDEIVKIVKNKQQSLNRMKVELPTKRELLNKLVTRFVKITLEVLDTTWYIIKEFKCDKELIRNESFDSYYCSLTDSLLLRIKILHISTLLATYDNNLSTALKSLKSMLESRYFEVTSQLSFVEKKIKQYQDLGPEFETLVNAYFKLLQEIKATEDDIHRIKNN
ncbi:HAUS augmin-like complex subunit 4-domain-containing protein [Circinella umbellata]|nr:HAUS augmin-like complex subunit 4-domain-containing protein [Circinella umbellata]